MGGFWRRTTWGKKKSTAILVDGLYKEHSNERPNGGFCGSKGFSFERM